VRAKIDRVGLEWRTMTDAKGLELRGDGVSEEMAAFCCMTHDAFLTHELTSYPVVVTVETRSSPNSPGPKSYSVKVDCGSTGATWQVDSTTNPELELRNNLYTVIENSFVKE
jgi:hypothetical protein